VINRIFAPALAALLAALIIYGFVPPPPRATAQFADQSTFAAAASTGSANAQAITIGNIGPSGSGDIPGIPLRFIPGFTNTGPATLSVSGLTSVNVFRRSSIGNVALSGQELLTGEMATVVYQTAGYYLLDGPMAEIGKTVEFRGSATPRGTLIEDGSCVSQTTYAPLFSVIGTAYGSCSAGLFALPDSRGTMFAALDNQGVNGAANRITSGGSGCTATSIGLCGAQIATLTASLLPQISSTNLSAIPLSVTSSANNVDVGTAVGTAAGSNNNAVASTGTITSTGNIVAFGITTTSTNTSSASSVTHPVLNPISLGRRAIKY
jgi:microcystin-dependent protein